MKYLSILLTLLFVVQGYSQDKERDVLIVNRIDKKIIRAFEYENDSLVDQSFLVEEFDKYGNLVRFKINNLDGTLKKETNYEFSEDGSTKFGKSFDEKGDLKYSINTVKNKKNRSVELFQISAEGDTLVHQKWIRDRNSNDSILYRITHGKRSVDQKWSYNKDGELISNSRYNTSGIRTFHKVFTYQKKGNCIKRFENGEKLDWYECNEVNEKTSFNLKNSTGYLYGIKLKFEKGGRTKETFLPNGLADKTEYFSKNNKLLAKIEYSYVIKNN